VVFILSFGVGVGAQILLLASGIPQFIFVLEFDLDFLELGLILGNDLLGIGLC
jgi:hypothetical protein